MTLDEQETRKLAEAWITFTANRLANENSEYFWAFEQLQALVDVDPDSAWKVIDSIRRLDTCSDLVLANLGAGPLEDLLARHGSKFIEQFETLARQDAEFRRLLGVVWQNNIADDLWLRIKAVAGPSW